MEHIGKPWKATESRTTNLHFPLVTPGGPDFWACRLHHMRYRQTGQLRQKIETQPPKSCFFPRWLLIFRLSRHRPNFVKIWGNCGYIPHKTPRSKQFCKARAAGKQTGTTPAVLKNISAFDSDQFLQQMKNFANPSKPPWKRNIHCKNQTGPSIMSKLCMCWRITALSCIILVIWHLATLW